MIYVCGDIHGRQDISKLNSKNFKEGKSLTKDDYVIICGDFGLVWGLGFEKEDLHFQKWLMDKPWTTLFVDGNHENFDLLNSYKEEIWNGGRVHRINDSIIHLIRGEIYNIEGQTIMAFGGGASHDTDIRKEGISWWKNELPVLSEIENAWNNLKQYNNCIDYIISHDGPSIIRDYFHYSPIDMTMYSCEHRDIHMFFDDIYKDVKFKKWYMGHYHKDVDIDNIHILFDKIKPIE